MLLVVVIRTFALLTPDQIQPRSNVAVLITARICSVRCPLGTDAGSRNPAKSCTRTRCEMPAHDFADGLEPVLLDHLVDAEVLADIPKHVEVRHWFRPVQIVIGGGIGSVNPTAAQRSFVERPRSSPRHHGCGVDARHLSPRDLRSNRCPHPKEPPAGGPFWKWRSNMIGMRFPMVREWLVGSNPQ